MLFIYFSNLYHIDTWYLQWSCTEPIVFISQYILVKKHFPNVIVENVLEGYCIYITVVATKPPQPIHNWSNIACVTNAKQRWSDNGKTKERYICPCPLLFPHFYPVVFDMFSPSPLRETQAKKTWLLLHFEIQWYSAWEVPATKCAHSKYRHL